MIQPPTFRNGRRCRWAECFFQRLEPWLSVAVQLEDQCRRQTQSSVAYLHLSAPPAIPTTRQPRALARAANALPTAPVAALTTTVSPSLGHDLDQAHTRPSRRACRPRPGSATAAHGWYRPCAAHRGVGIDHAVSCQPPMPTTLSPTACQALVAFHLAHRAANHHFAQAAGCGVALALVHAAAHVGVQAQVMVAHQHLAVGQRRVLPTPA